jgi:RHS repeat-associated protein
MPVVEAMRETRRNRFLTAAFVVLSALALPAQAADVVEYVVTDALGNVRVITDEQGNVVERHDYLPFGEECLTGPCASNPGGGAGQPRKFTGKERDAETGLDYFGARYYGSKIGRFTTVDPVYTWNENLLDPQRWNRYAYARNNPLRYVDPDGKIPVDTIWDVGNVLYDIYTGVKTGNWTDLGADALAAVIPYVPAGASKLRYLGKVDDAVDLLKAGDNAGDAARLTGKADDAADAAGVVYKRSDPKTGVDYVGRSKSEDAFLNRQRAHDRNLGAKHEYEVIDRAAPGTPLRAAEESAIRTRGGPGPLANKRYEMNDSAYKACGGTCDKP